MTKLEELAFTHLIQQLKEENELLKAEVIAFRKFYTNKNKKS